MESNYNQSADLFTDEPVVYGGFWERFAAWLIDLIILSVISFLIQTVLGGQEYSFFDTRRRSFFEPSNIVGIIVSWLYDALQESGRSQATIGKRALGIKVTSTGGQRISFGQATGRHFGKYLSLLILLIGYFMMIWDDKKQTLHDKLASTLVVKSKA